MYIKIRAFNLAFFIKLTDSLFNLNSKKYEIYISDRRVNLYSIFLSTMM